MRKMITCSFDDQGVIMTAWNGVHPDRNGHFSITKAISRMDFNDACQDRKIFGLILGIDISQGWQNALNDAIKNASPLKIDQKKTVDFLVQLLVAKYGEEKAAQIFEAAEKENNDIEALLKEQLEKEDEVVTTEPETTETKEEGNDGQGTTEKTTETGGKKSRRKNTSSTPADTSTDSVQ
jgi:hypothetical protein